MKEFEFKMNFLISFILRSSVKFFLFVSFAFPSLSAVFKLLYKRGTMYVFFFRAVGLLSFSNIKFGITLIFGKLNGDNF